MHRVAQAKLGGERGQVHDLELTAGIPAQVTPDIPDGARPEQCPEPELRQLGLKAAKLVLPADLVVGTG